MKDRINERINHLKQVLHAIKVCTQPVDGHDDPESIHDCWSEVYDSISAIESIAKKNVYTAWTKAIERSRNENSITYDHLQMILGTSQFKYLPEDNE